MNIYRNLGVEPIINACGAVTRLGGAPMPSTVLDAFCKAAHNWVPLDQLQAAASRKIAAATGTEAGLVTSGSAGALTLGTAAILAGHDLGRMERLPHCAGFPHEIIIAREQRSGYDHAIRATGAKLVEVGFNEIVSNAGARRTETWEYEAAITDETAGIAYVYSETSQPDLESVMAMAHRRKLPVLVDAAGELPPRKNLEAIAGLGADLVAFSGGKAIRGPQSTGILCGRRELISSAALQMLDMDDHFELWEPPSDLIDRSQLVGHPRHGIGRALKVSKEEIVALLTALENFSSDAYAKEREQAHVILQTIQHALSRAPVTCHLIEFSDPERWPLLEVTLNHTLSSGALDLCRTLRDGTPPIYVDHSRFQEGTVVINPLCLDPMQAETLGKRLAEELRTLES